jgi:hypothetical protein
MRASPDIGRRRPEPAEGGRQREVYRVGAAEAEGDRAATGRIGHESHISDQIARIAREPKLDPGISIPFSRSVTAEMIHQSAPRKCRRHHEAWVRIDPPACGEIAVTNAGAFAGARPSGRMGPHAATYEAVWGRKPKQTKRSVRPEAVAVRRVDRSRHGRIGILFAYALE